MNHVRSRRPKSSLVKLMLSWKLGSTGPMRWDQSWENPQNNTKKTTFLWLVLILLYSLLDSHFLEKNTTVRSLSKKIIIKLYLCSLSLRLKYQKRLASPTSVKYWFLFAQYWTNWANERPSAAWALTDLALAVWLTRGRVRLIAFFWVPQGTGCNQASNFPPPS